MLSFISQFPSSHNEKDGLFQRVKYIDSLFSDEKRVYLDISFFSNFKLKKICIDNVSVYQINFFFHMLLIAKILWKSKVIYVHSIYNSIRILPFYLLKCRRYIITDFHGVVPEELEMMGHKLRAKIYYLIELVVIYGGFRFIFVTKKMKNYYYDSKYSFLRLGNERAIILPIISVNSKYQLGNNKIIDRSFLNSKVAIYAGGFQEWQNISLMVSIAENNLEFKYIFLTPDSERMLSLCKDIVGEYICKSVPPEAVSQYYAESTFGFILRDDCIVNNVACPTKLIEYLFNGVIPIVKSSSIGDFNELGMKYVTQEEMNNAIYFSNEKIISIIESNYIVVSRLNDMMEKGVDALKSVVKMLKVE
ncbi:glycosyltransferase family protein [Aeromonas hydrophila]|uniref:hypothetical protein n=1 Tax=Aeromonas hydrophila TaxID=644 RepID=UPI003985CBC6